MAVLITAQNQEFGAALRQSTAQLTSFEKSVNVANNTLKSFGIGFGLFQVTAVVSDAIKIISDFEQQMATTKAITGATKKEFDELTRSALQLGSTTQFSAKQVGELQTEFGRLGFSTAEILNATKATISLATATGEDLAKSADVAGSVLRSFGLSTEETGRVVDVMAAGFNRSALSLENFSEAIKFVAPVARAAGVTLEETTALLGILADNGIRGSIAGTSLRKIITDLANSGKPLNERLADLAKSGLTFTGAFDEVGRTAQSSLLVLTENQSKIDAFASSLKNVSGEAEATAKIVGDTLSGDLKRLSGAWDGFVLSVSKGGGVLRGAVQVLTDIVNAVKVLADNADQASVVSNLAIALTPKPEDLANLKKFRDAAIQTGNKEAADAATKAIIDITNAYHLLGDSAKKAGDTIAKVDDQDKEKKQEQLSIIQALEGELSRYEEAKKNAFSVAEITALNDKIKGVKDQIELLNQTSLSPGANTGAAPVTPGSKTGVDFLQETGAFTSVTDGIATIDTEAPKAVDAIDAITRAWIASGDASRADSEAKSIAFAEQQARQEQLQQVYQRGADIIINSTAQVISGQRTALQAIKQITGQLISLFLQQALAGTIAGAAKTSAPPPVILALAAAGVAAISALFSSAVGGASGASAAGGMSASPALRAENFSSGSRSDNNVIVTGRIEASGRKLQVILDNQENKSGRTG